MTEQNYYKAGNLIRDIKKLKSILNDIQLLLDNWDRKAIKCPEGLKNPALYSGGWITEPFYQLSFLYFDERYAEMSYEALPVSRDAVKTLLETTKHDIEIKLADKEKELAEL